MTRLLLFGVAYLLLLGAAPLLSRRACKALGLIRPNFRGDTIPASVGITFLLVTTGTYAALCQTRSVIADIAPLFLLIALGFGLLGLADDLWGSRAVGGFRGHVQALLRGRPTTGSLKLLGGGMLALLVAWQLPGSLTVFLLNALIIALSANALNLLDVRPGRALLGFTLLSLPVLILAALHGALTGGVLLGAAAIAAALEWLPDTRGRAMMGDTGSNLLGALAGLAAAIELPLWAKVVLALILLLLNGAAERISLSKLIERTPWLAAIDRTLGVR